MLLGVLLAVIIVVCIALVGVILLQRSEGGALGMSGGGPGNFMTARGTGDLLTRTTQILAGVFFVLCLLMTLLSGRSQQQASVVDRLKINGIDPSRLAHSQSPAQTPAAPSNAPVGLPAPASTPIQAAPANPNDPFAVSPKSAPTTLPSPAR
jgi:preprotein translocase subunit SecG